MCVRDRGWIDNVCKRIQISGLGLVWLVANLQQGQTVGVDALLISAQEAKRVSGVKVSGI